ncbi:MULTISPECIES: hypothetical protein [Bacteria]|uniref:hypothetical protein n=1 Tax=Bacteria TaxID=2 RepID=UPI001561FFB8|nr:MULTISPECIES: hypothetical protein [Bacteria]
MNTTLSFKNADYKFIELIKEIAKRANIEVVENKISKLDKAIQEIKNGELERYKTFEDFEKSLNV